MAALRGFATLFTLCLSVRPSVEVAAVRVPSTQEPLTITDFHVRCNVVSRYAITTVQTTVVNDNLGAREAIFDVNLPNTAFISNFTLTVDNKEYVANVDEKERAQKIYTEAKRRGKTTAHVATRERETEKFLIAVNVEEGERVTFTLTYEELLRRRLGTYKVVLGVRPGQLVRNMTIQVVLSEPTGIQRLSVQLQTDNEVQTTPLDSEIERSETCAHISNSLSKALQSSYSTSGINGNLVVEYDVALPDLIGDIQTYNGYFVHFFSPRELPIVPKNVVFIIDVSSSMRGMKIKQTREAMLTILADLHVNDRFNILTFSNSVTAWKPGGTFPAAPTTISTASTFISHITAQGGTNINKALLEGAKLLQSAERGGEDEGARAKIIIFLTDGEPTVGVTDPERILGNVREATGGEISLFCLGFGRSLDFPLLQRLSAQNRAVARRIFEDSDANLQLKGFYDEVASPLLYDISLEYSRSQVLEATGGAFPIFFKGSELLVAGKMAAESQERLEVTLRASSANQVLRSVNEVTLRPLEGPLECSKDLSPIGGFVQRLWAYLTIKELLRERQEANETTKRSLSERALNLSLAYNFVTPLTSLVVVRPDAAPRGATRHPHHIPDTALRSQPHKSLSGPSKPSFRTRGSWLTHSTAMADGDPHFMVRIPNSNETLCFTIDGEAEQTLLLLSDAATGVWVEGHLRKAPSNVHRPNQPRTYFDAISVALSPGEGGRQQEVRVSLSGIALESGGGTRHLGWGRSLRAHQDGVEVTVEKRKGVTLSFPSGLRILVVLHRFHHPTYLQIDHLGVYLLRSEGLSPRPRGILGQLLGSDVSLKRLAAQPVLGVRRGRGGEEGERGELRVGAHTLTVRLELTPQGEQSRCWMIRKMDIQPLLFPRLPPRPDIGTGGGHSAPTA